MNYVLRNSGWELKHKQSQVKKKKKEEEEELGFEISKN